MAIQPNHLNEWFEFLSRGVDCKQPNHAQHVVRIEEIPHGVEEIGILFASDKDSNFIFKCWRSSRI